MSDSSARRVAILDVDGTLVDSNYHHAIAWHRALAAAEVAIPLWRIHRHIGMGSDRIVAALAGEDFDERHGEKVRHEHSSEYEERIDEVPALEGARELIVALGESGFEVVLASSAEKSEVEHYLDLLHAKDLVERWTTADDVEATKPDTDLLETALDGAPTEEALMVGDTTWDAIAAGRLGVRFLGVLSGGFGEEELRSAGAAAVYESLPALMAELDVR